SAFAQTRGRRWRRRRKPRPQIPRTNQSGFLISRLTERDRQPSRSCRRIAILPARLSAPPPLLAEAHLFGKARAGRRIIRSHHRIIWRQAPLFSILLRCQVILRPQMTLERLEFFSVFKADEMLS